MIGYGGCGVVSKFERNGKWFALKEVDKYKCPKYAQNEIKNEFKVFQYLNEKGGLNSFFTIIFKYCIKLLILSNKCFSQ